MLQITPKHKIYLAIQPIDFRRGIDGLVSLCQQQFGLNPQSGHLFVFRNKKATMLKCLLYDGQGFWLCQKRLSQGRFGHWPKRADNLHTLTVAQWQVLIYQGDPASVVHSPAWAPID